VNEWPSFILQNFVFGLYSSKAIRNQIKTLGKSFWLGNGYHVPWRLGRGGPLATQLAYFVEIAMIQASFHQPMFIF
jgi:hypothetical protein